MLISVCLLVCLRKNKRTALTEEKMQTRKGGQPKHEYVGEFQALFILIYNIFILLLLLLNANNVLLHPRAAGSSGIFSHCSFTFESLLFNCSLTVLFSTKSWESPSVINKPKSFITCYYGKGASQSLA